MAREVEEALDLLTGVKRCFRCSGKGRMRLTTNVGDKVNYLYVERDEPCPWCGGTGWLGKGAFDNH